jgi:hypothetical protein
LLAVLLVTAALLVRLAVPAGFMPVPGGGFAITICTGYGPLSPATAVMPATPHAMSDMHHGNAGDDGGSVVSSPCAFADLAMPALSAADPVLLAAALLFILAAALVRAPDLPVRAYSRVRPPLRGPPLLA